MDNYIDKSTFLGYMSARLTNAKKGADSSGIALRHLQDAKSFRIECKLIPALIKHVRNDKPDSDLSPTKGIQLDYYYWHCILMTYCWKYEFLDGFFHRMAIEVYTYRNQRLERLKANIS